jgi:2-polyprenyl-3-methyl-5-hydroxy-6-metoxy-1,4-benzoquinol methylase
MSSDQTDFPNCPICGGNSWRVIHDGEVRDGAFGAGRTGRVARCAGCGIDRLAESLCLPDTAYRTEAYRDRLGQGHDLQRHFDTHDELVRFTLDAVWPHSLRGKVIADIGCGGGSLLDHVAGVAREILAVDPDPGFAASLKTRGYLWSPSTADAAASHSGRVDVAFSIQVIEHVADPRAFLADIGALLAPHGIAIVSTPNRTDVLMDLLPDDFPRFFYRTQHRWYFDDKTLARCADAAGLSIAEVKHVHRYAIANAMLWLRDRRPQGRTSLPPLDPALDLLWRSWLESNERADNICIILKRKESGP